MNNRVIYTNLLKINFLVGVVVLSALFFFGCPAKEVNFVEVAWGSYMDETYGSTAPREATEADLIKMVEVAHFYGPIKAERAGFDWDRLEDRSKWNRLVEFSMRCYWYHTSGPLDGRWDLPPMTPEMVFDALEAQCFIAKKIAELPGVITHPEWVNDQCPNIPRHQTDEEKE